ncbi:MAG: hypothetical protein JSU91_07020 [Thermoplasmatales archaeon]|nr:MAG: hypothetical protein JSU91_07020 [Thermoplasmatales archaeon]
MKGNPVLYKALVVGVIVLFIGVGVQPAIADVSNISISDSNEDCNLCPKVSKQHIVRIKGLIDGLDTLNTKLSKVSKLNPELEEKYQDLSDRIAVLSEINEVYLSEQKGDNPIICGILVIMFGILITPTLLYFLTLSNERFRNIKLLFYPFFMAISIPALIVGARWWDLCLDMPPP